MPAWSRHTTLGIRRLTKSPSTGEGGRARAAGTRPPRRERYRARLVAAHDARDMAAYQIALNGYVAAAREAYRKKKQKNQRNSKSDALNPDQRSKERGLT